MWASFVRADWLEKTEQLIVPKVNYFQVVFTLPDQLSGLILGNRQALYDRLSGLRGSD